MTARSIPLFAGVVLLTDDDLRNRPLTRAGDRCRGSLPGGRPPRPLGPRQARRDRRGCGLHGARCVGFPAVSERVARRTRSSPIADWPSRRSGHTSDRGLLLEAVGDLGTPRDGTTSCFSSGSPRPRTSSPTSSALCKCAWTSCVRTVPAGRSGTSTSPPGMRAGRWHRRRCGNLDEPRAGSMCSGR